MTAGATSTRPYPGPRPFEPRDRSSFFGRDAELADLTSFVIAHRVVLLYAQSGAGKTSLLNAGLIPSLSEQGFVVLPTVRVRGMVSDELAAQARNIFVLNTLMCWSDAGADRDALLSASIPDFLKSRPHPVDEHGFAAPYVIVFDQFEELFAFYPERWAEREEFFVQVSDALHQDPLLHALFVMREDYVANLDPYTRLMPGQFDTRYRLERLRPRAACEAAEGPLRQTTRRFAPHVADHLVDQLLAIRVEDAAGRTREAKGEFVEPVQLQIAFESLWSELPPDVTVITDEHLRAYGDVNQALGEFYEQALTQTARETGVSEDTLREWFDRRLITPAGTRGTVFRGPDATEGVPNKAVDFLENRHLIRAEVRAGGRWYELTHDRFIRPIKFSNDAWRKRVEQAQLRVRRQKAVLIALVVLGAVVATAVVINRRQAVEQRRVTALEDAANALLPSNTPEQSICLALRAAEWEGPAEEARLESVLRQALRNFRVRDIFPPTGEPIVSAAFRPDGGWLVMTAGADHAATMWDGASRKAIASSRLSTDLGSAALSRDGALIATATLDNIATEALDNEVQVAKVTGEVLFRIAEKDQVFTRPQFSPDGTLVLVIRTGGSVRVWNVAAKRQIAAFGSDDQPIIAAAFSPDNTRVVTASLDDTATIWHVESGRLHRHLVGHRAALTAVAFSPDGRRVLTASEDTTARLWDAELGSTVAELRGHRARVNAVAFAPNGQSVVTAADDGTARTWMGETGAPIATLRGHQGSVTSAAFKSDSRQIVTAGADGTARIWDVGEGWLARLPAHPGVSRVSFSDDGRYVITRQLDIEGEIATSKPGEVVKVSDARTGAPLDAAAAARVEGIEVERAKRRPDLAWLTSPPDYLIAWSGDNRLVLTSNENTASVREAASGMLIVSPSDLHAGRVTVGAIAPGGTHIATASSDQTVQVWTLDGQSRVVLAQPDLAATVEFPRGTDTGPAGLANFVLTTSPNGSARVWDVSGRTMVMELNGAGPVIAAFSPDGTLVATARSDGAVATYHCETCAPVAALRTLARERLGTITCNDAR